MVARLPRLVLLISSSDHRYMIDMLAGQFQVSDGLWAKCAAGRQLPGQLAYRRSQEQAAPAFFRIMQETPAPDGRYMED